MRNDREAAMWHVRSDEALPEDDAVYERREDDQDGGYRDARGDRGDITDLNGCAARENWRVRESRLVTALVTATRDTGEGRRPYP